MASSPLILSVGGACKFTSILKISPILKRSAGKNGSEDETYHVEL
jgi:hypothetical protein